MENRNEFRQTGITTKQMKEAPDGAVYIWCNGHLDYPNHLAKAIGRSDIKVCSPFCLDTHRFMGVTLAGVVLDHAAQLNERQWFEYQCLLTRVMVWNGNKGA